MATAPWERSILAPDPQTAYFSVGGPTGHGNEDRLSVWTEQDNFKACIADGHWGDGAAQEVVDFWSNKPTPRTRNEAVERTLRLQTRLFELYGREHMDPDTDRTPEAGFVATEIAGQSLLITSYGDCRLLIVNNGQVRFKLPKAATWLGAFSHLGLRNRISVQDALVFRAVRLLDDDYVALYSDGLDEWRHDGELSLHSDEIADSFDNRPAVDIVRSLGELVFAHDPQDDVSLLVRQM